MGRQKDKQAVAFSGCREWASRIESLLDGDADEEIRRIWERHSVECEACGSVLQREGWLRQQMDLLPDPGAAVIADRVMRRVRSGKSGYRLLRPRNIGWGLAGGALGVFIGVILGTTDFATADSSSLVSDYVASLDELAMGLDPIIEVVYTGTQSGDFSLRHDSVSSVAKPSGEVR